jgi:hypothetical protein
LAVMIWYVLVFTSFSLITVNNGSLKGITKVMIKK